MSELSIPNLILTVNQGTGKFTKDENGNPIEATTPIKIYASVKKSSNPQAYRLPGISTDDIFLVGKVVAQSIWGNNWIGADLPDLVNLETQARGELTIGMSGQKGVFRFSPVTQARIGSIRAMGERINGYLRVTARN